MFTWASIGIFQPAATPGSRDPTRDFRRVGIPESVLFGDFFFFFFMAEIVLLQLQSTSLSQPSVCQFSRDTDNL